MRLPIGLVVLITACGLPGDSVEVSASALTTLEAGDASLRIPNGALAQDTEMVFRVVGDGKLGRDGREEVPVAPVLEILPHDVQFQTPATVTFTLTEAQTASLRVAQALTAVDGWQIGKDDDERYRPRLTTTDVDTDAGIATITLEIERGGYVWAAHENIGRPGMQANLGNKDRILVDVEGADLEEEIMEGAVSLVNRSPDTIFGVQVTAGSPPLIAEPGTQARAELDPEDRVGGARIWGCIDDGPAEAAGQVTFQWNSDGGAIILREYRAVECYEEDIIIDDPDVPDLCPEPEGDAVISAEFQSISATDALMVWDEGACQTVLSEVSDGIEQVYFRARPQQDAPERARADYVLLSATLDGVPGDGDSTAPRVADVGNFAVFETQADNLIGDVVDTEVAIVKFFPDTLEPALINRFDVNPPATTSPALSGNGQWVAAVTEGNVRVMDLRPTTPVAIDFLAAAHSPEFDTTGRFLALVTPTGLVETDTDGVESVYLADRDPDDDDRFTGEPAWSLVSVFPDGGTPNAVEVVSVAGEGQLVAWIGDGSVYLTDVSEGRPATQLVSLDDSGTQATEVVSADVSKDGSFVVFSTREFSSSGRLEAWSVDTSSFVATRVAVDEGGDLATEDVLDARIAPDGEVVTLATDAVLSADDTDGGPTVYRVPNPLAEAD